MKARWTSVAAAGLGAALAVIPLATGQDVKRPAADLPAAGSAGKPARAAPPIDIRVRVLPGKKVPANLEKYVTKSGGLDGQSLRITGRDAAAVTAALLNPDLHVELDRPKQIPLVDTPPLIPLNLDARLSHRVPEFEAAFADVRGDGVLVAVFDGGRVLDTHQEFKLVPGPGARVTVKTTRPTDTHATHVAGTVGASGVDPLAKGMATAVRMVCYDFFGDDIGAMDADGGGFQVSNHSYGPYSGWSRGGPFGPSWHWWGGEAAAEDAKFGKYADEASRGDAVLAKHAHLLTFVAAGNDRGEGPAAPVTHYAIRVNPATGTLTYVLSSSTRPRDGSHSPGGMDTVTGMGLAKNAVCVGAVNDILPTGGGSVQATAFTGVGPADDGRIKPDLVANGLTLLSTSDAGDAEYTDMSGTSMASPTAAGIGALLWDLFKKKKGRDPTSAEIKAALIHTARDAGVPGPDPIFGWGAIDAVRAGRVIAGSGGAVVGGPADNTVGPGQSKTFSMTAAGDPIRVSLVWIDPPALPNPGGLDDAAPVLVNDLDLKLTAPDGTTSYLPYSLDLGNLWDATNNRPRPARTDRPNRVDNVEVIDAPGTPGKWTVEIRGRSLPGGGSQSFALIVSGLTP